MRKRHRNRSAGTLEDSRVESWNVVDHTIKTTYESLSQPRAPAVRYLVVGERNRPLPSGRAAFEHCFMMCTDAHIVMRCSNV